LRGAAHRLIAPSACARDVRPADLFFEKGVGQFEMLMFVGVRVEKLTAARADALHVGGVVHGKPGAFVKVAGVTVHVPPAGLIHVEPDHLLADRTLRDERVKPPSPQQLDELNDPYR
jgi:hypothetical protein